MIKVEKLFQPAKIGSLEIANRIIMTAVTTDTTEERSAIRFYAQRPKVASGLSSPAPQTIYPSRKTGAGRINLYDDSGIPKLKEW
jgi:2,4-dienoyl-CoA reductase-like NADH-dependent reductase (Old Yellow Enzyme family)